METQMESFKKKARLSRRFSSRKSLGSLKTRFKRFLSDHHVDAGETQGSHSASSDSETDERKASSPTPDRNGEIKKSLSSGSSSYSDEGSPSKTKDKEKSDSSSDSSEKKRKMEPSEKSSEKRLQVRLQEERQEVFRLPPLEETPPSSPRSNPRFSTGAQSDYGRLSTHTSAPNSPANLSHNFNLNYRGGDSSPVALIHSLSAKDSGKHASQLSEISFASPPSSSSLDLDAPGDKVDEFKASPSKTSPSLKPDVLPIVYHDEEQGVWRCGTCGWIYPAPNPSLRNRREHKKYCGEITNVQRWLGAQDIHDTPDEGASKLEESEVSEGSGLQEKLSAGDEHPMAKSERTDNHEGVPDMSTEPHGAVDQGRLDEIESPDQHAVGSVGNDERNSTAVVDPNEVDDQFVDKVLEWPTPDTEINDQSSSGERLSKKSISDQGVEDQSKLEDDMQSGKEHADDKIGRMVEHEGVGKGSEKKRDRVTETGSAKGNSSQVSLAQRNGIAIETKGRSAESPPFSLSKSEHDEAQSQSSIDSANYRSTVEDKDEDTAIPSEEGRKSRSSLSPTKSDHGEIQSQSSVDSVRYRSTGEDKNEDRAIPGGEGRGSPSLSKSDHGEIQSQSAVDSVEDTGEGRAIASGAAIEPYGSSSSTSHVADLEKVVREQNTHYLICPVCRQNATKNIILIKRNPRGADWDSWRDQNTWGCLACLSFFILIGNELFPRARRPEQEPGKEPSPWVPGPEPEPRPGKEPSPWVPRPQPGPGKEPSPWVPGPEPKPAPGKEPSPWVPGPEPKPGPGKEPPPWVPRPEPGPGKEPSPWVPGPEPEPRPGKEPSPWVPGPQPERRPGKEPSPWVPGPQPEPRPGKEPSPWVPGPEPEPGKEPSPWVPGPEPEPGKEPFPWVPRPEPEPVPPQGPPQEPPPDGCFGCLQRCPERLPWGAIPVHTHTDLPFHATTEPPQVSCFSCLQRFPELLPWGAIPVYTHTDLGLHDYYVPIPDPSDETPSQGRSQEYLKSVVHGGLDVTLVSLGVVASAAGGDAKTKTVIAIGLATLVCGFVTHFSNSLKRIVTNSLLENSAELWAVMSLFYNEHDKFLVEVGQGVVHGFLSNLFFLFFGALAPVTFGFAFQNATNRYYKMTATIVVALVSIVLLGAANAHVHSKPAVPVISVLVVMGFLAVVGGYETGNFVSQVLEYFGFSSV